MCPACQNRHAMQATVVTFIFSQPNWREAMTGNTTATELGDYSKNDAILHQSECTNLYNHLINYTKSIYMGKVIVSKMTQSNRSFNIPL